MAALNEPTVSPLRRWFEARLELGREMGAATLRPMEGLRGVAVLLVFLVHYATLVSPWVPAHGPASVILDAVHAIGNVGVDLFFVLSGFLIYGGLIAAERPFLDYLWRRVRRIYPAFLAVFALYLVLSIGLGRTENLPREPGAATLYVLWNLLLLPGLTPIKPLIAVAWSLSYEFCFYLLVPLVIALTGLRQRSRRWRLGFIMLMTMLALAGFAIWGGPVRMTMFLAGMLLHEWLSGENSPGCPAVVGLAAGLLALAVPLVPMPGPALQALRVGLIYAGFFCLCLAAFQRSGNALARCLAWTPLRWMGNVSYSYYLLHGLALQAFFSVAQRVISPGHDGLALALLLPAWLATLPPCLMLFLLIERPLSLAPKSATARRPAAALKS